MKISKIINTQMGRVRNQNVLREGCIWCEHPAQTAPQDHPGVSLNRER